jgi:hypothetical protein
MEAKDCKYEASRSLAMARGSPATLLAAAVPVAAADTVADEELLSPLCFHSLSYIPLTTPPRVVIELLLLRLTTTRLRGRSVWCRLYRRFHHRDNEVKDGFQISLIEPLTSPLLISLIKLLN